MVTAPQRCLSETSSSCRSPSTLACSRSSPAWAAVSSALNAATACSMTARHWNRKPSSPGTGAEKRCKQATHPSAESLTYWTPHTHHHQTDPTLVNNLSSEEVRRQPSKGSSRSPTDRAHHLSALVNPHSPLVCDNTLLHCHHLSSPPSHRPARASCARPTGTCIAWCTAHQCDQVPLLANPLSQTEQQQEGKNAPHQSQERMQKDGQQLTCSRKVNA